MHIDLTTPALLFPAVSLLLLAYTNRFLVLASLVRSLHAQYQKDGAPVLLGQIENLRRRLSLIRDMQLLGVLSLLLCVVCMFVLFVELVLVADVIFGISLVLMTGSLALSAWEIRISVGALSLHLSDLEHVQRSSPSGPGDDQPRRRDGDASR
jgi:hypothetical protein